MSTNPYASLDVAIFAPLYFAVVLTTAFYGVSCMQTFYYYVHYPNDRRFIKIFVGVMWALDTIHEALTVAGVYKLMMNSLANPASIMEEIPEINILSEASVALPVQAFFVYRIYIFSGKNIFIPLLWSIQAIFQIVAAILYEAKSFYTVNGVLQVVGFTVIENSFFTGIATTVLVLALAVDVFIAVAMTFLLVREQKSGKFTGTTHVLQRLTMFAVNTGTWTALFAILSTVFTVAFKGSALSAVFSIPLSSVYCNTLLANLNARTYIRGERTIHSTGTGVFAFRAPGPTSSEAKTENQSEETKISPRMKIQRTTEVVTFSDADRSVTPENMA